MGSTAADQTSVNIPVEDKEEEDCFLFAMQLASSSVLPMVLTSAIELDLLETIAKAGPEAYLSPRELATHLPNTNNPEAPVMLDRICRLLACYSVLKCTLKDLPDGRVERLYGLTPMCKFFIKNEDGASIAPIVLMNHDKIVMKSWYHLKDAVLEGGIPFNKAYGITAFEYMGKDPRFNKVANIAMFNHSTMTMKKILDVYDGFDGLKTLVDVAGGIGASLKMIVSKHPLIKGINFDLPHVIEDATPYPGIEYVGGDMFVSVPKGDAIFLKWICHNWSDEQCIKLLKNCYEAVSENGKVIVAEFLLNKSPDSSLDTQNVVHMDVMMFMLTPGGKERTAKEFEALAKAAGFKGFRKACCAFHTWIMEFSK